MSYSVPTIDELVAQGIARHRAELPGTDAGLWPNTEHVYIKAIAGLVAMNYDYLEWVKRQRFATEADADQLETIGRPWGILRNAASAATGSVVFTGTAGTTIPAGSILNRSDGQQFATTATVVIDSDGITDVAVNAIVPGAAGNTDINVTLTLAVPITGVTSTVTDTIGLGNGAPIEDLEAYRDRILQRQQNEPMGGSDADYVRWSGSQSGITRIWVEGISYGPGTVGVWFMTDGSTTDGIPSPTSVATLQAYLDGKKPAGTRAVIVKAPVAAKLDVQIAGLNPNAALQGKISSEVANLFRRRVAVSQKRTPFTFRANAIWQAVARLTGDVTHTVTLPKDVTLPLGYIPTMGTICYSN